MVGMLTHGAISYQDCQRMPFDLYTHLLTKVPEHIKTALKEGSDG
jgi:hypothetical protein